VRRLVPLLILVIGLLACYVDLMPGSKGLGSGAKFFTLSDPNSGMVQLDTKLGLDLQGGFEVKYGLAPGQGDRPRPRWRHSARSSRTASIRSK